MWSDTEYVNCEFLEEESKALINKYTKKKIYVTEELKELAKNKFESKEEIRWNREIFYTRFALLITFLGLMASILVPLLSTSKVEIENPTQTHNIENELKKITSKLNVIASGIDTSINIAEKQNNISQELSEIKRVVENIKIDIAKPIKK